MIAATPIKHRKTARSRGFTLIELLMVVTVILILAGITFGISRGVQNAQARAKAKAELATIAQALEQFKSVHGDYPWAEANPGDEENNGEQLLEALAGFWEFDTNGTTSFDLKDGNDLPANGPEPFIDLTRVSMNQPASALPNSATEVPDGFFFADPWGNPYVYRYKASANGSWERFGFVLFSMGPDSEEGTTIPNTGIIPPDDDDAEAVDNIYAGE